MKNRPLVFLAGLVALGLVGCASASKPPAAPVETVEMKVADNTKVVTKEYEYVRVTGSLIPVKVPKNPNAHPLPGANPVTVISAEDFEKIVQRGLADKH